MKKLMILLCLMICVIFSSNAKSWDWQTTSNALLVADWMQTLEIQKNDNYYETNNIIGSHPDRSDVNIYFASMIILNNIIGEKYGDNWYMIVSVNQALYVGHNYSLGINFSF